MVAVAVGYPISLQFESIALNSINFCFNAHQLVYDLLPLRSFFFFFGGCGCYMDELGCEVEDPACCFDYHCDLLGLSPWTNGQSKSVSMPMYLHVAWFSMSASLGSVSGMPVSEISFFENLA